MAEQLTNEQLIEQLAEALESWPLYRELLYTGALNVKMVPQHLTLFCPNCLKDQFWETDLFLGSSYAQPENNRDGFGKKVYKCRNCGHRSVTYYFYWGKYGDEQFKFFKVGQWPPLDEKVPAELNKLLDEEDLKLFRTAIRLRNFNLGLGAVAYLRRVVENRMDDILDVLHESAKEHKAPAELLDKLGDIKAARRFSDKVDYAACLLPETLHPEGLPNPIGILHELTSDGLHSRPDEECVEIFDRCRDIFEHVFTSLRPKVEEQKAYVKRLTALAKKKASADA